MKIDLKERYCNIIGNLSYTDCSCEERNDLFSKLAEVKLCNDYQDIITNLFLSHMFILGLQNINICLEVPNNMHYSSLYVIKDVGKYTIEEIENRFCISEENNKVIVNIKKSKIDYGIIYLIVACACREIYQIYAISQTKTGFLVRNQNAFTRVAGNGIGYIPCALSEEMEDNQQENLTSLNEYDLLSYIEQSNIWNPSYQINPIPSSKLPVTVLSIAGEVSRYVLGAVKDLSLDIYENMDVYLVDTLVEINKWIDINAFCDKNFLKLKNKDYHIAAVGCYYNTTAGASCHSQNEAAKTAIAGKRVLDDIFSNFDKNRTVCIFIATEDYYSSDFGVRCGYYCVQLGLKVNFFLLKIIPSGLIKKEQMELFNELFQKVNKLSKLPNVNYIVYDYIGELYKANQNVGDLTPEERRNMIQEYQDNEIRCSAQLKEDLEKVVQDTVKE